MRRRNGSRSAPRSQAKFESCHISVPTPSKTIPRIADSMGGKVVGAVVLKGKKRMVGLNASKEQLDGAKGRNSATSSVDAWYQQAA